jgi:hypothetical protein
MANIITPFAQTFFVDSKTAPDGMFVAAIDLCFKSKDGQLPVIMSLTSTTNGYPDIGKEYHNAEVLVFPTFVNTSTGIGADLPSFTDSTKYTRFTFRQPIYLPPGEHAFVLKTNSIDYDVFVARLEENILGTDRRVSKQPYSGSLFKSQNGSTWTAIQDEDVMFRIHRAKFDISSSGVIYFNSPTSNTAQESGYANSNVVYDAYSLTTTEVNFGKTKTSYSAITTSNSTGSLDPGYVELSTNRTYIPTERKVISGNTKGSFKTSITLSSTSDFVSPIIDTTRLNSTFVTNIINDGGLTNSIVAITASGSGYNSDVACACSAAIPAVTISAPTRTGGVTATAVANVTPTGTIDAIYIINSGSGYTETPTVTISEITGTGNSNASAIIVGETSRSGGNSLVRYTTRKVTLADGFDARDIKVFITANRFPNHDIQVYYKVLSSEDPDQNFDNKYWTRMRVDSNSLVYAQNINDFAEYTYVPSGAQASPPTNITYVSNGVTYDTFRYFAIKICMFSNSNLSVPVIKDMRAIALE